MPRRCAVTRLLALDCTAVCGSSVPGRRTKSRCSMPTPGCRRSLAKIRRIYRPVEETETGCRPGPSDALDVEAALIDVFARGWPIRAQTGRDPQTPDGSTTSRLPTSWTRQKAVAGVQTSTPGFAVAPVHTPAAPCGLCAAIGVLLESFEPDECANDFRHAGYGST